MAPGKFTDSGFRYRENYFSKEDNWIPGFPPSIQKFYDIVTFNSDTVTVGDDYMVINEIYFRLHNDKMEHQRVVYGIMEWLGAVGGVGAIVVSFFKYLYGGYASFNAAIVNINLLHNDESHHDSSS